MSETSGGSHRLHSTPHGRAPADGDDRRGRDGRYVDPVRPNPAAVPVIEQRVLPAKTSAAAVVLTATIAAGVTTVLNSTQAVNRLDKQVQKLRDNLPAKVTTRNT